MSVSMPLNGPGTSRWRSMDTMMTIDPIPLRAAKQSIKNGYFDS